MNDSSLAVALGSNRSSSVGSPRDTLIAVRLELEDLFDAWSGSEFHLRWSALHETVPVGGPQDQPPYWNAVLFVDGVKTQPNEANALELLDAFQSLEQDFGRDRLREQRWGPRTLDLDFLFWGELRLEHPRLVLPHPRMHLRSFVLEPLLQAMQGIHPPCW